MSIIVCAKNLHKNYSGDIVQARFRYDRRNKN